MAGLLDLGDTADSLLLRERLAAAGPAADLTLTSAEAYRATAGLNGMWGDRRSPRTLPLRRHQLTGWPPQPHGAGVPCRRGYRPTAQRGRPLSDHRHSRSCPSSRKEDTTALHLWAIKADPGRWSMPGGVTGARSTACAGSSGRGDGRASAAAPLTTTVAAQAMDAAACWASFRSAGPALAGRSRIRGVDVIF